MAEKPSLKERLIKNSTIGYTSTLEESKIFGQSDMIPTPIPIINVALMGRVDGGLQSGTTMVAGPSKHFKTGFCLMMCKSFIRKYPKDGIILFYDSEFGSPASYFKSFEIPTDQVIHSPLMNIEELKFDIMQQLENLDRKDKVLIMIDSIGNLASKKEVDDAISGSSKADMSRARQLKSFFRIITPYLTLKDIPLVCVNHTYQSMEMFSKAVVSGGTGPYLSSDNIWILGRRQDKEGKQVVGYDFVINIEKSRHVREKSKIPISVSFEGGIKQWSGLLELALEFGLVTKPKVGWYASVDTETGEINEDKLYREKDIIDNGPFWTKMLAETDMAARLQAKFTLAEDAIMAYED